VKLVTAQGMREMEALAERAGTTAELMEQAGLAVAQETWVLAADLVDRPILVLVGPGNNGGDGLVAARHLHDWGARVKLYLLRPRRVEEDANFRELAERGIPAATVQEDPEFELLDGMLAEADIMIDALLGTGAGPARPIEGAMAEVLKRVKEARSTRGRVPPKLVAVDLPTGVDPDTGAVDPHCVAADVTVALGFSKVGLHLFPGRDLAGRVQVVEIGIPGIPKEAEVSLGLELMDDRSVRSLLPPRPADAHKGAFGKVLVVAGSINYTGAAALACLGAARVGAGLVTLACPRSIHAILASRLTEATFLPLPDQDGSFSDESISPLLKAIPQYDVLLIGCGLGLRDCTRSFLDGILRTLDSLPLRGIVLDADGLNALAQGPGHPANRDAEWWRTWALPTVLTPHPGEMARLTGLDREAIQRDRLGTTLEQAARWGKVVALKGAHTIVAEPGGRARVSPFANPALATAGTGDVLAGAMAGFMAQGLGPFDAATCGVYLHGKAGEEARRLLGSAGVLAGDLVPLLPRSLGILRGETKPEDAALRRPSFLDMLGSLPEEGMAGGLGGPGMTGWAGGPGITGGVP